MLAVAVGDVLADGEVLADTGTVEDVPEAGAVPVDTVTVGDAPADEGVFVGTVAVGDADAEDKDGDGWSETDCTTATGWFGVAGRGELVAASAVPAAAPATATPAMIATLTALRCRSLPGRRRDIRCAELPCTAGGGPDGHSAASKSAASPRWERP